MRRLLVAAVSVALALPAVAAPLPGLGRPDAQLGPSVAVPGPTPEIVNGVFTSGHPAVGALFRDGGFWCSGTLIGCRTFLTAAHCMCRGPGRDCRPGKDGAPDPARFEVFFQHAGFVPVERVFVHPRAAFPAADVAVLRLAAPVDGVRPMSINAEAPVPPGTEGTIVGFGRSDGGNADYGLKREGRVETAPCSAVSGGPSVCWDYTAPIGPPGLDSNTCNGDSGGPLLVDLGYGPRVAGVTSGGISQECRADDSSYNASVYRYRTWIAFRAGDDLDSADCSDGPYVGDPDARTVSFSGTLLPEQEAIVHQIQVPAATRQLRIALNGAETPGDIALRVKRGKPPRGLRVDCEDDGSREFGYCEINRPTAGDWFVEVRVTGTAEAAYQVTATAFCDGPCGAPAPAGGASAGATSGAGSNSGTAANAEADSVR